MFLFLLLLLFLNPFLIFLYNQLSTRESLILPSIAMSLSSLPHSSFSPFSQVPQTPTPLCTSRSDELSSNTLMMWLAACGTFQVRFCFPKVCDCFQIKFLTLMLLAFCYCFHLLHLGTHIIAWNSFCISLMRAVKALEIQFILLHVFFHSCEMLGDKKPLNKPSKHLLLFHSLCQFFNRALLMCLMGALMSNALFINFLVVLRAFLTISFHSFFRPLHVTRWFSNSVWSLQNRHFVEVMMLGYLECIISSVRSRLLISFIFLTQLLLCCQEWHLLSLVRSKFMNELSSENATPLNL